MKKKKMIAVVGATGFQGSGLVNAILNSSGAEFAVRAITRTPESDKAKALAMQGVEVVAGNIDDEESMIAAFKGCYGAYCATFFWEHFSALLEQHQARLMALAAKAAGLKHVIWSTLEDSRDYISSDDNEMRTLQNKFKIPHFDGKGAIDHVFTDQGVPVTFLRTSFYWDNLYAFDMGPKNGVGDEYELTFPIGDARLSGIAAEDIGKCALGIFERGEQFIGKTIGIVGENLTGAEMAKKLSKGLNLNVKYCAVSPKQYLEFGFPGADVNSNMFQFFRDYEEQYLANRDQQLSFELSNGKLLTFDSWLEKNKHKMHCRIKGVDVKKWTDDHQLLGKQYYIYFSKAIDGVVRVMQNVEVHLAFLLELEKKGKLVFSGPFVKCDESDFEGGGMVVLCCDGLEEAKAIADADPFHILGVRSYTLVPWLMNEGQIKIQTTYSDEKSKIL